MLVTQSPDASLLKTELKLNKKKVTPQDTFGIFIGSGALSYPWFADVEITGFHGDEASDDWSVTFCLPPEEQDEKGKRYTLDHKSIMRKVHKIVRGTQRGFGSGETPTRRECRLLITNIDECDFDANAADCVLQAVAFDDIVYG